MKLKQVTKMVLGLGLAATAASAAPVPPGTSTQAAYEFYGSDTLNGIMTDLYAAAASIPGLDPTIPYNDCGSGCGENQMEGSTSSTEPPCASAATDNPGCEEVSPMSRSMNSGICNDAEAQSAEAIAVCGDDLAVPTTCADADADLGQGWRQTLSLLYTGCNGSAANAAACYATPRLTRCASQARKDMVANYYDMFEDGTCETGQCDSGIRRIYRRDDSSGTTGVFTLLISAGKSSVLGQRSSWYNNIPPGYNTAVPTTQTFCDGGDTEGFYYNYTTTDIQNFYGGTVNNWTNMETIMGRQVWMGDPIRTACCDKDDICDQDGKMGLVRAIRSTPNVSAVPADVEIFPTKQCTWGKFTKITGYDQPLPRSPDGRGAGSVIYWPYYDNAGTVDFNCINRRDNRPNGVSPSMDARWYNAFMITRTTNPGGDFVKFATRWPQTASWRMNMVEINYGATIPGQPGYGGIIPASAKKCQFPDATDTIGCLTAPAQATTCPCALGYAGRQSLTQGPNAAQILGIEPGSPGYELNRPLFINAIGGFEYIEYDGLAAGRDQRYVDHEIAVAKEFYNVGTSAIMQAACSDNLYTPFAASVCYSAEAADDLPTGASSISKWNTDNGGHCGQYEKGAPVTAANPRSCDPSVQLDRP